MPRFAAIIFCLCLALLPGAGARAATDNAQARFAEARAAFDAANFARALILFEECLSMGMQGPAIHYNIGVAAYRSGDYARAERAFREVAGTPAMAPLAYYNLGLVALKRGEERSARGWFERALHAQGDERVTALAAKRLQELPQSSSVSIWSWYARGGIGYDDNVALRSESVDTTGSGESDAFGQLLFSGSFSFRPLWRVDAAAGLLRYADLGEFDQSAFSLGVARGVSLHDWYLELGGYAARLSLGGDVYERSIAAAAQASRSFTGRQSLRAQLRATTVDGEGDFSGLSGSRAELGLKYDWGWHAWSFAAHTRAELNDSEDEIFASRWVELGVEARWAASPFWAFTAGTAVRKTRHPAQSTTQPAWDDRRIEYRLEATRGLWKNAQVYVRYAHESNESPLEGRDYDRNWVGASIEVWH